MVAAGGTSAAVVIAEPGLGKTRLLAEVSAGIELPFVQLHQGRDFVPGPAGARIELFPIV